MLPRGEVRSACSHYVVQKGGLGVNEEEEEK